MIQAMVIVSCVMAFVDFPNVPFGDIVESSLDLSGDWEGNWFFPEGISCQVRLRDGKWGFYVRGDLVAPERDWVVIDEGHGKLKWDRGGHGIYEWKGNDLIICWGVNDRARPKDFSPLNGRNLLIIHRVRK